MSFWKKERLVTNELELGIKERLGRKGKKKERAEVDIWISKDITNGTRASGGRETVLYIVELIKKCFENVIKEIDNGSCSSERPVCKFTLRY